MDPAEPIAVYFLLLPQSLILDWAGPAEALRVANQVLHTQGLAPRFQLHFVSPQPSTQSSVGVTLCALEPLPQLDASSRAWVVLVGQPGQHTDVASPTARSALHWLRGLRLERGRVELLTVCAGAVLAAHAGLLHGRRATTHHQHLDELQAVEPACAVQVNRVFVEDGPVLSSAGVTTGVDLVLHCLAQVCGPALTAQVAQTLVVALRRGPLDPQLSPFLAGRNHLHAGLHRVQDAISQQPRLDWDTTRMAQLAHTSPRNLARLFLEHAAVSPLQYLRRIRLALAQAALQSGSSVTQAAHLAGFRSDTQLRRAWHSAALPGAPSEHPKL